MENNGVAGATIYMKTQGKGKTVPATGIREWSLLG